MSNGSTCVLVQSRFGEIWSTNSRLFQAPGRVNLIGEHTDYNDGFVMPATIGFYTWVAAAKRNDCAIEVYSEYHKEKIRLSLDELSGGPRGHWSDFVRGVAAVLVRAGHGLSAANLAIAGDIPLGAGLSSSASLEVATALAMTALSDVALAPLELAKLCQQAEHEYVGTKCGIMDQFSAALGEAGKAIMLDCRSLEHQPLTVPSSASLVICNSMVRHQLASGEYNRRRHDCETGVGLLRESLPNLTALRDVSIEDLERNKSRLPGEVFRRCRHVVMENQRVLAAAKALDVGNAEQFGQLMFRSHASLRDDYAVSCKELDLLVDLAASSNGVYGARMTGGGFGGCTVNLVRAEFVTHFASHIRQGYELRTGITPDVYVFPSAEGIGPQPIS